MLTKLTEKIKSQKSETIQFDFKEKYEGIAGCCPDCNSIVSYDVLFHKYVCINPECGFEANINRERIVRKRPNTQTIKTEQTL